MSAYARGSSRLGPARPNGDQLMQFVLQSATVGVWIHTALELLFAVA